MFKNYLLKTTLYTLSVLAMACFTSGCDTNRGNVVISEGTISYAITYPGRLEGGLLDGVLPKEMKMEFQNFRYVNTISAAGMFESKLITNCKDKTVTFTFNFGPKKIYAVMSEKTADSLLHEQFKIPTLFDVPGTEMVAGYRCNRTFAVFDELEEGPDFEIKFTDDIQIKQPNWCNQFSDLDAVLLEYELKQYGLRLKLRANTIEAGSIQDSSFEIPAGFKLVSIEEMVYQFEEVFKNFQ